MSVSFSSLSTSSHWDHSASLSRRRIRPHCTYKRPGDWDLRPGSPDTTCAAAAAPPPRMHPLLQPQVSRSLDLFERALLLPSLGLSCIGTASGTTTTLRKKASEALWPLGPPPRPAPPPPPSALFRRNEARRAPPFVRPRMHCGGHGRRSTGRCGRRGGGPMHQKVEEPREKWERKCEHPRARRLPPRGASFSAPDAALAPAGPL